MIPVVICPVILTISRVRDRNLTKLMGYLNLIPRYSLKNKNKNQHIFKKEEALFALNYRKNVM